MAASLAELIGAGHRTLLAAPWRRDGHPDHDAAGRAAAEAARRTGARLVEYPIRAWQDRSPDHAPWRAMRRLELTAEARRAKEQAIAAHVSQVCPDATRLGSPVLPEGVLAHFAGAMEHFVVHESPVGDTHAKCGASRRGRDTNDTGPARYELAGPWVCHR